MRLKTTFILLACVLLLCGCASKRVSPSLDLAAISGEITKKPAPPSVIEAVEDGGKKSKEPEKLKAPSARGMEEGNTYLKNVRASATAPKVTGAKQDIQLNFDNADIYEVIQVVTSFLDINYIVDPAVKGVVNIKSGKPIPKSKLFGVFQKILHINGLDIRKEGDYYYIYPSKKASTTAVFGPGSIGHLRDSPRMVIQVVPVMYIPAPAAAKLLEPYLSEHGSIYTLPDQNLMVVADFESKVLDVLLILARLDVSPLASLKVRLVKVKEAPLFTLRDEMVEILSAIKINKKDFEGVTVLPLERVNALLLVGGDDSMLDTAEGWIEALDVVQAEGRDNIYIYNVRNSVASDLASLVNDLISGKNSATPLAKTEKPVTPGVAPGGTAQTVTTRTTPVRTSATSTTASGSGTSDLRFAGEPILLADDSRNIILLRALPPDYTRLTKLLERLDNMPRQVLIEVIVAEVKLSDSWKLGVEWSLKETNRFSNNGSSYTNTYSFGKAISDFTGLTYSVLNSAGDVVGLLQTIASDNDLTILSSPQLMVLNNETASINVGDQVPIITTQTSNLGTSGTDTTTETVQYKDTGVILSVSPKINYDGIIILDVIQQVSSANTNELGGTTSPIISNRELKTKLAVKNGQSIMMGGLISTNKNTIESGIPIVKDIPLLGWLFKSQEVTTDRTELLVMITPYVIESEGVLDQYIQKFREKVDELQLELKGKES